MPIASAPSRESSAPTARPADRPRSATSAHAVPLTAAAATMSPTLWPPRAARRGPRQVQATSSIPRHARCLSGCHRGRSAKAARYSSRLSTAPPPLPPTVLFGSLHRASPAVNPAPPTVPSSPQQGQWDVFAASSQPSRVSSPAVVLVGRGLGAAVTVVRHRSIDADAPVPWHPGRCSLRGTAGGPAPCSRCLPLTAARRDSSVVPLRNGTGLLRAAGKRSIGGSRRDGAHGDGDRRPVGYSPVGCARLWVADGNASVVRPF